MTVVVGFAILAAVAFAAVLLPIARPGRDAARREVALAIYRDQLAELDRDRDRGLIGASELAAAKIEVERRLVRAARNENDGPLADRSRSGSLLVGGVAAAAVPILAVLIYTQLGSPTQPDQPFAAREAPAVDPAAPNPLAMVASLERKLADNPQDLEGWLRLGRSRLVLQQGDQAVAAYRKAAALAPDDPRTLSSLAEALTMTSGGMVTPEARNLFARLWDVAPGEPQAAYYLGLAEAQAGRGREAIDIWQSLLRSSPADAPWREPFERAIRRTAEEIGEDGDTLVAASGPVGDPASTPPPSTAAPPDHDAMVGQMVAELEAKLEAGEGDAEGWLRLGQARMMLGQPDAAREALSIAMALAPEDPQVLRTYASSLLGEPDPSTGLPKVPPAAGELFKRAADLQPEDPIAHWYLGIRALQDRSVEAARDHWQKVLAALGPDHPDYQAVKSQLDALGS